MVLGQRQPENGSPQGASPEKATAFEVNLIELGMNVPSAVATVVVDVVRNESGLRVLARNHEYWYTLKPGERPQLELLDSGREYEINDVPQWVRIAVEYAGVEKVLQ